MSEKDSKKEADRMVRLQKLNKQVEMLELRARLLEAKVRIADAQDRLGITPPLKK